MLCTLISSVVFGLSESTGPDGSNAQAVWDAGYTGQGISVGLISQDHARITHEVFAGHAHCFNATDPDNTTCLSSNHDTSVGGIICSRGGALYPNDKGVAPSAELYSVKVVDGSISTLWLTNALDYLISQNCQVVVTAIQIPGTNVTPDGTSIWSRIYDYYAYEHNLIFVTAAGNYESGVTVFGDTYNSITTGGLAFDAAGVYGKVGTDSNPGPTIDQRSKPEICAPSQEQWVPTNGDTSWGNVGTIAGQTSYAVPHTAGVAALLLDYADESDDTDREQNQVIKAAIVNSTFPNILDEYANNTIYPFDPNLVWNAYRGYGRLDAHRALETLRSPRIAPGLPTTTDPNGWAYETLVPGEEHIYLIKGKINQRLLVTVTWNRRIQWNDDRPNRPGYGTIEEGELVGYLANLDLEIRDPDGILLNPNPSEIDNLEKYDLLLTKTGSYEVRVVNQSGSEMATYGLAFEILEPLPGDVHVDYVVDTQDLIDFVPHWLSTDCNNPLDDCSPYNLSLNPQIDLSDFSILADNWLTFDNRYYTP